MTLYNSDHLSVDVRHKTDEYGGGISEIHWYSERHDFNVYLSGAGALNSGWNVGYGDYDTSSDHHVSTESYERDNLTRFDQAMAWCAERLVMALTMAAFDDLDEVYA